MTKYSIPECNMAELQTKMKKVENKCKKYSLPFVFEIGEGHVENIGSEREPQLVKFFDVTVDGKVLAEDGYVFVAKIDHSRDGGNVVRQYNTEFDIPTRYQTSSSYCDHCHTNRYRVCTYLLYNADKDDWKQVGKSCMADYMGNLTADRIAAICELFHDMEEMSELKDGMFSSYNKKYFPVRDFLFYAKKCVDLFGYCNAQSSYPTSERAYNYYKYLDMKQEVPTHVEEEVSRYNIKVDFVSDKEFVDNLIEWVISSEDTDNYMSNLRVIFKSKYFSGKEIGYVTSSVISYIRYLERIEREEKRKAEHEKELVSEYVGNIGDKVEFDVVNFRLITSFETQYGMSYLYKFNDENGNVFTWITSNMYEAEMVESVKGTIKDHKEYNSVKETVLTRCKLSMKQLDREESSYTGPDYNKVLDSLYA